jgi:2-polyprenyl-3-methyl-5-hydroxy-6-metoxy-1,4-benzoquinol methylase
MSYQAKEYGWTSGAHPASCAYVAPRVARILAELDVRRVCDVGCGNGSLAESLRCAGLDVVGVERDAQGIEIGRRLYPGITFYQAGVEDDPRAIISSEGGALFDAVVTTEVVEHLFAPHLLPRFARPLLRPGGYLVISSPYHGYLKNVAIGVLGKWDAHHTALWHGGHIKFWSRRTLTDLLVSEGFSVDAFVGAGRIPLLWKSMILVARVSE